MRKLAVTITISASIGIAILLITLGYLQYRVHLIEKETYEYLLENHEPHEIYEVKGGLGFGQLFTAAVIFEDEKDTVYEYAKKDGEIIQLTPEPGMEHYKSGEPKSENQVIK